ncbi:hypothetical protein, partial [Stenotrophomonas muris]|uniref:hypothetical protein n=1 Tax=Stenotrophomonas muris TaxID=2963283 RepID=UPI00383BA491
PRHPCRGHPALPTHPAAGRFRVRPPTEKKKKIKSKRSLAARFIAPCRAEGSGAAANVTHGDGAKGDGQDDRHSHARITSKRSAAIRF